MFAIFQDALKAKEIAQSLLFTANVITRYSSERFLSICGQKMFEGFLKFCIMKLVKPDTRSDHCLKSYKRT